MPAATNLAVRRAKKSPASPSLMARSAGVAAKPCERGRPRTERGKEPERLPAPCTRGAGREYLHVSALACPPTTSQPDAPDARARGVDKRPAEQRGLRPSYLSRARTQYTKPSLPSCCHENLAYAVPGGTRRNREGAELARRSARRRHTLAFRVPSREFNPCPAYDFGNHSR